MKTIDRSRVQWTVPESVVIEARCLFCNKTGDLEWANKHWIEKKYYRLPRDQWIDAKGTQFGVTKQLQKDGTIRTTSFYIESDKS